MTTNCGLTKVTSTGGPQRLTLAPESETSLPRLVPLTLRLLRSTGSIYSDPQRLAGAPNRSTTCEKLAKPEWAEGFLMLHPGRRKRHWPAEVVAGLRQTGEALAVGKAIADVARSLALDCHASSDAGLLRSLRFDSLGLVGPHKTPLCGRRSRGRNIRKSGQSVWQPITLPRWMSRVQVPSPALNAREAKRQDAWPSCFLSVWAHPGCARSARSFGLDPRAADAAVLRGWPALWAVAG